MSEVITEGYRDLKSVSEIINYWTENAFQTNRPSAKIAFRAINDFYTVLGLTPPQEYASKPNPAMGILEAISKLEKGDILLNTEELLKQLYLKIHMGLRVAADDNKKINYTRDNADSPFFDPAYLDKVYGLYGYPPAWRLIDESMENGRSRGDFDGSIDDMVTKTLEKFSILPKIGDSVDPLGTFSNTRRLKLAMQLNYLYSLLIGKPKYLLTCTYIQAYLDTVSCCGIWYPLEKCPVLVDRPTSISVTDKKVIHNENGAALSYNVNFDVYVINGEVVGAELMRKKYYETEGRKPRTLSSLGTMKKLNWEDLYNQFARESIFADAAKKDDYSVAYKVKVSYPTEDGLESIDKKPLAKNEQRWQRIIELKKLEKKSE